MAPPSGALVIGLRVGSLLRHFRLLLFSMVLYIDLSFRKNRPLDPCPSYLSIKIILTYRFKAKRARILLVKVVPLGTSLQENLFTSPKFQGLVIGKPNTWPMALIGMP